MAKLMGIDVGTSGCKVLLIDETGKLLRQATAEYPISTPQPGWSEQNPEDWWDGVQRCLAEIDEKPDAIGVTGQMHGAVFLDSHDQVIRPALLWNDQRTVEECEEIDATVTPELVRHITRNPPITGFQAPKVLWLRNHELSHFQRLRSVLLPKDYIRFKLTGEKATDASDASGTGLFNVPERRWSEEMMLMLELDPGLFPPAFESDEVTGATSDGVPVVAGAGDQAAAAVGTGTVEPGIFSVSLGTSGVVFTAIPDASYDSSGAAHTFCHANRGWHAMGVMLSCGGAMRWYRDTFRAGWSYEAIAEEASRAVPGCNGLTFLPYLSGERCPVNDPSARAALAGASLSHGGAEFSRAVFEGASFGLLGCKDLLVGLGAVAGEARLTSGGAKSAFWRQMIADLFQMPCTTLEVDEGPAMGAAILAGVGIGVWKDVQTACREVCRTSSSIEPGLTKYDDAYQRYQDLYSSIRSWNPT